MSKGLYADGGLYVTSYAGPVREDGGDRKRVQITDTTTAGSAYDDGFVTLSMEQWEHLRIAVERLGVECDGPEL